MAGMACLDSILKRKPNFKVTVLSEEPYFNYNRILLSAVLAGEKSVEEIYINTKEWYEVNNIMLCRGVKAVDIDSKNKLIHTSNGSSIAYDLLLLATGSNPFIPPIDGIDKQGVFTFRNIDDAKNIIEACQTSKQ